MTKLNNKKSKKLICSWTAFDNLDITYKVREEKLKQ
jgi:hypothetical protein